MIDLLGMTESSLASVNGLTITVTIVVITISLALWTMVRPKRFPPGPRGLPIVGSIFSMNDSPEIIFSKWAKEYGDVVGFKAGERWMVVLSSPEVIKEAMIKQGVDFAGRPDFFSVEILSEGFKDIALSPYSETWKLHRKLAHTALRNFATGKPLQHLISSSYPKLEKALSDHGDKPLDPKPLITLLLYNILMQMCFGKSYPLNDPQIKEWIKINDEFKQGAGLGLAADFFSWAKYLPTGGQKMVQDFTKSIHEMLEKEIRDFKTTRYDPENISNFYSLFLKAQDDARDEGENVDKLTDTHIRQTIGNIFGAGISTTADTLCWVMALMAEYPEIQAKVQTEIDQVIGRDRVPTIEDRGTLPYTECTLYEVMRYSALAPISTPRATTKDTKFRGYLLPKGTVVLVNLLSMLYDPKEWDDPQTFKPEHFLDASGAVRQHPSGFLPFGIGRRSCLGEAVAKADLFLIFTWFLQNYNFSKVPGKESENLLKIIPQTAIGRILLPYEIVIKKRDIKI